MMPVDIKTTKRMVYTAYHGDGIIDISIGVFAVVSSLLFIYPDYGWMATICFIVTTPIYIFFKNTITVPRIGYVRLQQGRRNKMGLLIGFAVLTLGVMAFALFDFIPISFWDWMGENFIRIMAGLIAVVFLCLGAVLYVRRLYGYAILSIILIPLGDFIGLELYQIVLLLGILIVASGAVVLYRFMISYPKTGMESGRGD